MTTTARRSYEFLAQAAERTGISTRRFGGTSLSGR